jgi:trehalose synthase
VSGAPQQKLVEIPEHSLEPFRHLLGRRYEQIEASAERARHLFDGRTIWHVSSTERGGGVAEMLCALLPYARGAGIDTRWVVPQEPAEFFELTKRLHNHLHGEPGDEGPLGAAQHELYERVLAASASHLCALFQTGDIVFLHDPQTAGLAPMARAAGTQVIWRCHIGVDHPDELARAAWDFLAPYLRAADAFVFSRREYFWDVLDHDRIWLMAPCIDPFSVKNQDMDSVTVDEIVGQIGLGPTRPNCPPTFRQADGTRAAVERRAEILQEEGLPEDAPVIAQISRWDRLKDHPGLLTCFERHLDAERQHLVLAGPATSGVTDDPEGAAVWHEVSLAWEELPAGIRRRVHLVSLPMEGLEENAAMVNALQRRADIVVQKSLAEGFGLTVAEAMWKRRPVVGTRVGGIQDQIVDGVSGLLIDDPTDLESLARAITDLADNPRRAMTIGERAKRRVCERFLAASRLSEYVELLAGLGPTRDR